MSRLSSQFSRQFLPIVSVVTQLRALLCLPIEKSLKFENVLAVLCAVLFEFVDPGLLLNETSLVVLLVLLEISGLDHQFIQERLLGLQNLLIVFPDRDHSALL